MPRRRYAPPPQTETPPGGHFVHRGYTVIRSLARDNEWYIVKDNTNIGVAKTELGAREMIDGLFPKRNRPGRAKRTARGRARGRPLKNSAASDRKPMRAFTLSGVRVEWFQGYAEDVRYLRASDGKKYSHVVETDAAELYLCSHPEFGHCLLIVDPSGRTPLWK